MTAPRISLSQQLEAVQLACTRQATLARGATVKALRTRSAEDYDLQRLQAVTRTLLWLQANEAEIRAFIECKEDQS